MNKRCFALSLVILLLAGCQSRRALMPTPNLYLNKEGKSAFSEVPEHFQTDYVDVLYVTDRVPLEDEDGNISYSMERSPGNGVGICRVQFGKDLSWEQLVRDSLSRKREHKINLAVTDI